MSGCSYLYDNAGLRWEEGSVLVTLTVDGAPQVFSVVRVGRGSSRLERFEGRSHPLDTPERKVFGEVSLRDLERLAAGTTVVFVRDGVRSEIVGSLRDGRFPAEVHVGVDGSTSVLPIEIDPSRAQGSEGRLLDESALRAFLAALTTEDRRRVALAQVATMPKSGRAGGPAARRRLQFLARELPPARLAEALLEHPDALLHVTPQLLRNVLDECLYALDAGDDAQKTGFTRALAAAVDTPEVHGHQGANVVLASLFVLKTEGGAQPDLLPGSAAELAPLLRSRLAAELVSMRAGTPSLEVLATNQLVQNECVDVLRSALAVAPSKVLTEEFGFFLSRVQTSYQSSAMLDFLVGERPVQALSAEGFFATLPVATRLELIRREPRFALSHVDLDVTSEDLARSELRLRNERIPLTRAEERVRRLRTDAEDVLTAFEDLRSRVAEFDRAFTDRLRRLRQVELSELERDRLMAYGGLSTELREFRWMFERRAQDVSSRLDLLTFDVRFNLSQAAIRRGAAVPAALPGAVARAQAALAEMRQEVARTVTGLDDLRRAAVYGDVRDFAARAEALLADLPVSVHRHLLAMRESVEPVASAPLR